MKKVIVSFFAVVLLVMAGCTQKAKELDSKSFSQLAELSTVEYTVSKVIKCNDDKDLKGLFGSRKVIFTTVSTLKAGFDMSELKDEDVKCKPSAKSIHLTLPAPKILYLSMKPEDIALAYEESTGLRGSFTEEERNKLLVQGEEDIRNNAHELGILEEAKRFGEDMFTVFLKECGYEDITIDFQNN